MTLLARPVAWVGSRGRAVAVLCAVGGLLALLVATLALEDLGGFFAAMAACARDATRACEGQGTPAGEALATLFGPLLAFVGAAAAAVGLACLLRRRGRLDARGQRLLDDAARHHASGALSTEGFRATCDRIQARAAAGVVPQVALAASLWGGALAVLTFLLAATFLGAVRDLRGLATAALPLTRTALATLGACTVAALAGATLLLLQAARWRARTSSEATALQAMLTALEADVLDEVRRSAPK